MRFLWGVIDVIGGLLLVFNSVSVIHTLLFYFGVIISVKGMWILFENWRKKVYFDLPDWIDVLSGAIMLLVFFGVSPPFVWILGMGIIIKGIWAMFNAM